MLTAMMRGFWQFWGTGYGARFLLDLGGDYNLFGGEGELAVVSIFHRGCTNQALKDLSKMVFRIEAGEMTYR